MFIGFASTCFILSEYILLVVGDAYLCVSVIVVIMGVSYTVGVLYRWYCLYLYDGCTSVDDVYICVRVCVYVTNDGAGCR